MISCIDWPISWQLETTREVFELLARVIWRVRFPLPVAKLNQDLTFPFDAGKELPVDLVVLSENAMYEYRLVSW
jgi:hypothetical protein